MRRTISVNKKEKNRLTMHSETKQKNNEIYRSRNMEIHKRNSMTSCLTIIILRNNDP